MIEAIVVRMEELLDEIMMVDEMEGDRIGQLARSWEEVVLMLDIGCSSDQYPDDQVRKRVVLDQLEGLSRRIPVAISRLAHAHSSVAQQLFAENRRMLSLRGYAPQREMVLRHYI
ncbi:MAG: hypothetical protein HQL60_01505 [Magnetococcales bacterium]|nr:hypothetical protein [Magnetococcales bacterium]